MAQTLNFSQQRSKIFLNPLPISLVRTHNEIFSRRIIFVHTNYYARHEGMDHWFLNMNLLSNFHHVLQSHQPSERRHYQESRDDDYHTRLRMDLLQHSMGWDAANYPTAIPLIHCNIHTKIILEIQIPATITDDSEIIPLILTSLH